MLSNQIRSTFLEFFARNGHAVLPSSSLIPHGDRTILFTNAGMNQFKNAFLGLEKRDYQRAATAQKVMRVSGKHNDLENVGPSRRHHTFFEMLGNFSFGDYFKADAMKFALDLLEGEYGFERERLWFTIFKDDDDAHALWQKVGISPSRILRFGEKDNFWSMGPTGPCGPNSEVHYFTGKLADNDPVWVNNDDDPNETTTELWNLVFMQFDRDESGKLTPLPRPGVDTGMGFERLCRLLQGGASNYESDLFMPVMDRVQALAGHTDAQRQEHFVGYRVIADHARAAAFLIGDGVLPGNEGRNYVLRMIMRRGMRFGRTLGFSEPFLFEAGQAVIDKMGGYYTELSNRREHIVRTIFHEEERFARTLDQGLARLEEVIGEKGASAGAIPGEAAFKLYDTYGLPLEITRDIARERGLGIDEQGFAAAREASKEQARQAGADRFVGNYDAARAFSEAVEQLKGDGALPQTGVRHDPYGPATVHTRVAGILRDGEMTELGVPGETIDFILSDSPFYVESGGQICDTGFIRGAGGAWLVEVLDTQRPLPGCIAHRGRVLSGQPQVGDACTAEVDAARRAGIMRNHTATHLLQAALRGVLGTHVSQQGSLVAPDRLRFDFAHGAPLTREELDGVAERVNALVLADLAVWDRQESYKEAVSAGAMALFSEKYGDVVRVVRIGDDDRKPASAELCGGTHVKHTGEIGAALIVAETAVASGVRRIEAVTGTAAMDLARRNARALADIARELSTTPDGALEQVHRLNADLGAAAKALLAARRELARYRFEDTLRGVVAVGGAGTLVARVDATDADLLREMTDWFRARHASGTIVLGAVIDGRPALVAAVSADLVKRGLDAGKLVREAARICGGGGGGKPTLAQAGGKDASKLDDALAAARTLVESTLGIPA